MTIDALIDSTLERIYRDHYDGKPRHREWFKSQPALMKAIARYGHECWNRGWEFDADAIYDQLRIVLNKLARHSLAIEGWFPVYLEAAVDSHVRNRADELSVASKKSAIIIGRAVAGLRVGEVRRQTDVETMNTLYRNLAARKVKRKAVKKPAEQPMLF